MADGKALLKMSKNPMGWRIEELQAVAEENFVNRNLDQYQFTVRPLSKQEGGGYLVEYPDIRGCMSDGETIDEAIANGREALLDCLEVFK